MLRSRQAVKVMKASTSTLGHQSPYLLVVVVVVVILIIITQ